MSAKCHHRTYGEAVATFAVNGARQKMRCGKCHSASPSDELEFSQAQDGLEQPKLKGDFTMLPILA